ncbi:MAG: hypothetical protein WKG07_42740 [Hymenobacter sp.]
MMRMTSRPGMLSGHCTCSMSRELSGWSYLSPNEVNPGAGGILEALEKMNA